MLFVLYQVLHQPESMPTGELRTGRFYGIFRKKEHAQLTAHREVEAKRAERSEFFIQEISVEGAQPIALATPETA